ncbi:MAG: hypothetical protein D6785_12545, partial [Planctomycetota bacterium]
LASLSKKEKEKLVEDMNNRVVTDSLIATFEKHNITLENAKIQPKEAGKQWELFNGGFWQNRYYLIRKGSTIEVHGLARKDWWDMVKEYWHGDPVKLEGNSANPLTEGKLCIRGQASLSRLYHAERLKSPLLKVKGKWQKISWTEALTKIQEELKKAKGKKNLFLSAKTNGSLAKLQRDFCEKLGLKPLPQFEALSYANLKDAYKKVVGIGDIPFYHIEKSDFLLSLGADLEETFLNPTIHSRQIARARKQNGWKWFHVEPGLTLTGLHSQKRWICRPGSETVLVSYLLQEWNKQNKADSRSPQTLLKDKVLNKLPKLTKKRVIDDTGLGETALEEILKALKESKKPLFIVGGASLAHEKGFETAFYSVLLQWALGSMLGESPLIDFSRSYGYEEVGNLQDYK